jgi:hypothetical protein
MIKSEILGNYGLFLAVFQSYGGELLAKIAYYWKHLGRVIIEYPLEI